MDPSEKLVVTYSTIGEKPNFYLLDTVNVVRKSIQKCTMIWAWVPYSRAVLWCRSLFHWRWHLGLDLDHYFYFLWHLRSKGLAWRWVAPKDLRRPKQASYLSPLIEHDTSVPLMSKVVLLTDRTEVKRHWSISFSSSLGAVPLGAAVEFSLSHHPWELLWLFFFF